MALIFTKRLDVGTGLAQSVKQTRVPYDSSYSSWKEDLYVQLLPQDDQRSHLESNRSVGMAALHCPEVAPTPPVEKYQDFGQNYKEYFSHRLMQLLAIRTKPDARVVDIHLIITPLWLWASVLKGKI